LWSHWFATYFSIQPRPFLFLAVGPEFPKLPNLLKLTSNCGHLHLAGISPFSVCRLICPLVQFWSLEGEFLHHILPFIGGIKWSLFQCIYPFLHGIFS
jgi:hypothetical protein